LTDVERLIYILDLYFDYGDLPNPGNKPILKSYPID